MKYFGVIRKYGWHYFFVAAIHELRKKRFIFLQQALYSGKDRSTYSQYAEDLFIDRILGYRQSGTYIDVGANHPSFLNNTKKFYDRGWSGINVEPNSEHFKLFLEERPRDTNLNVGVGPHTGTMDFFRVNPSTLSTFSSDVARKLTREGYRIVEQVKVPVSTLADIFGRNKLSHVNFLSIDTEGYDLQVLKSNDWAKYRADLLCIEAGDDPDAYDSFLAPLGYKKIGDNGLNVFFLDVLQKESIKV